MMHTKGKEKEGRSMDIFAAIAERKITEAIHRGELDNLALKGQPIRAENLSDVPEELRMGFKILKNAGILPEELQLNREIITLRDLIESCREPDERKELKKTLTARQLHYDILMERNFSRPIYRQYESRIRKKLGV
jgi:hypothetical protein